LPRQLAIDLPETVVVTGAASGLGLVVSELLVSCGCYVFGVDIAEAKSSLAIEANYEHLSRDVANPETGAELADLVQRQNPESLGVITAAAVLEVAPAAATPIEVWRRTLDINVLGTVFIIQGLYEQLRVRGGVVAAVASVDATFAEQQLAAYAASKGAVRQFIRTLALDHAREGVRANVISPGPMRAGLFERHLASADDPAKFLFTREQRQPMGRILGADEVARVLAFAVSSASSGWNGADIIVDGGLTTGFDFRTGEEGASV